MIDFNKPITTRCGYPVEIWTTEANAGWPIRGEFFDGTKWESAVWLRNGNYETGHESRLDLINPPEEIEGWVNIYITNRLLYSRSDFCHSKELADKFADDDIRDRIACIQVRFKEGDGL